MFVERERKIKKSAGKRASCHSLMLLLSVLGCFLSPGILAQVNKKSLPAQIKPATPKVHRPAHSSAKEDNDVDDDEENGAEDVSRDIRVEDILESPMEFHYAAFSKPDPFVPPMTAITENAPAPARNDNGIKSLEIPILSPLQQFELTDLTLVGVWQVKAGERKAMVLTPSGKNAGAQGIIVKVGDPIGSRGGKVAKIDSESISVREFMLDADGTRKYFDEKLLMGKIQTSVDAEKIRFTPGSPKTEIIFRDGTAKSTLKEQEKVNKASIKDDSHAGATDKGSTKSELVEQVKASLKDHANGTADPNKEAPEIDKKEDLPSAFKSQVPTAAPAAQQPQAAAVATPIGANSTQGSAAQPVKNIK